MVSKFLIDKRELATGRIPYEGLSITQILGSVGYGDD